MVDIKGLYQEKADELAQEEHNAEFYDLPDATQIALYSKAMELVNDNLTVQADLRRKE